MLPQALYVRRRAPRFAAANGHHQSAVGMGPNLKLLALGDSIVAGVGVPQMPQALAGQTAQALTQLVKARISWTALGRVGATSSKLLERLASQLPSEEADLIILSVGVNDITSLTSLARWRGQLTEILKILQHHAPSSPVAVAGIPPLRGFPILPNPLRMLMGMRGERFDQVAQEVVSRFPNAVHVPLSFEPLPHLFSADGFHPSAESYRDFGVVMAECLLAKLDLKSLGIQPADSGETRGSE